MYVTVTISALLITLFDRPVNYSDTTVYSYKNVLIEPFIVQELCESRGGRPGLSVLTSLLVSVDVKIY